MLVSPVLKDPACTIPRFLLSYGEEGTSMFSICGCVAQGQGLGAAAAQCGAGAAACEAAERSYSRSKVRSGGREIPPIQGQECLA